MSKVSPCLGAGEDDVWGKPASSLDASDAFEPPVESNASTGSGGAPLLRRVATAAVEDADWAESVHSIVQSCATKVGKMSPSEQDGEYADFQA